MNYAGIFGTEFSNDAPVSLTDHHIKMDSAGAPAAPGPIAHDTIIIPDAQLLFSGDFNRLGNDLMLSKDGHEFLVEDYFRGEKRAFLASPDGASLSGDVVQALTGHVQYAQAGGAQSAPKDIGQVSKLAGTASVIRNGVLVELHSGDRVYKSDVVQAGPNSSLSITFIDGTVFGLSPNARMVLNEMVYDQAGTANSALISLVRGTISFVAGETAKHGDMKVETPVATMGIRGTAVLVEIGFEIPSDGKDPPVNFQVLMEPDGTTGSYNLYSKSDPSVVIGTVDRAGQVFSVSGNGTFANLPSTEMSQLATAIIQQVFSLRFQGYVPDKPVSTPQGGGGGSPPPSPPSDNIPKLHDTPDGPVIVPITIQVPDGSGGNKTVTIPVGVGVLKNSPPTIVVTDVSDATSFNIADRVKITDIDATNSFHDVAVPYVRGTATIVSASGLDHIPTGTHLADLITIDPLTGRVSYDPADFGFLGSDGTAVVTIGFDSRSGPDTVHETLKLTIDGVDAPSAHLISTDVCIDISAAGATSGFTFAGAGNVTTPGTPEDRIALGYHIGSDVVIHNSAPLYASQPVSDVPFDDFTHLGSVTSNHSTTVVLGAGNGVTLTQTIDLGADANYFTTTIKIANDSDTAITDVSFLRNIDPDQDVAVNGDFQTFNKVLQNPDTDEHVAAISATGTQSGVSVTLIGLGSDWHATFYGSGLAHSNPYDPDAFGETLSPTTSDQSITLINNIGTVAARSSVEITYLTTANVATSGDNALIGTSGNDTINGLGGNDFLIGLGGADNFVFAKGSGQDTILDFKPGTDTIELDGLSSIPANSFGQFTDNELTAMKMANAVTQVGTDTLIHLDGADTVLLKNVNVASLHANDFIIHPGTT